jgi:hypothetical protein
VTEREYAISVGEVVRERERADAGESVYRRYAIVPSRDLNEGVAKLAMLRQTATDTRTVLPFSAAMGTIRAQLAAGSA